MAQKLHAGWLSSMGVPFRRLDTVYMRTMPPSVDKAAGFNSFLGTLFVIALFVILDCYGFSAWSRISNSMSWSLHVSYVSCYLSSDAIICYLSGEGDASYCFSGFSSDMTVHVSVGLIWVLNVIMGASYCISGRGPLLSAAGGFTSS